MKHVGNSIIDQLMKQRKRTFNNMQNVQLSRRIRLARRKIREREKLQLSKTNLLKSTKSGRHK